MKNPMAVAARVTPLLASGTVLAQGGNMMDGTMWSGGWMGGYLVPVLVIVIVAGVVAFLIKLKDK